MSEDPPTPSFLDRARERDKDGINFTLSRDFRTLMFIGQINSFFGWLLALGCAIGLGSFVFGWVAGCPEFYVAVVGVVCIPFSLLVVASGQVISCFVSTERNTNDTNGLLKQILDKMEENPIHPE